MPGATATPPLNSVPLAPIEVMITFCSELSGPPPESASLGSVKPKSPAARVLAPSSLIVKALFVPIGASFFAATLNVNVRAVASVSMSGPFASGPNAVPPSSWTLKTRLKVGVAVEFKLADGVNVTLLAAKSPMLSVAGKLVIAAPAFFSVPLVGAAVMITFSRPFCGESLVSVKLKSSLSGA